MFEQERKSFSHDNSAFVNAKGIEYSTGNPTIKTEGMTAGEVIPAFTAISRNEDGTFSKVESGTTPVNVPLITVDPVKVVTPGNNVHVGAVSKANLYENACYGVTDAFKTASNFFFY